ncbi:MAG: class I SAM-dependent methyltransferase [Candidatus Micrarchaeaceae archaeon]
MNTSVMLWVCLNIEREDVFNKRIIEVGSQDVNGTVRPLIMKYRPREYIGVDMVAGKNVDLVVDASRLTQEFGERSFDVVISTEMLEHVRDWRSVIHNLKAVLKEGGLLIISTRSKGFGYHAYPYDFWRYEIEDISRIFSDMEIIKLDKDAEPGY